MKNKYKSEFLESLHETAVGLHKIGVISGKEIREYDKDCLVPAPKTSIVLDSFEQSIENNAEQFVPLSDTGKSEVETIINAAVLKSMELLRQ